MCEFVEEISFFFKIGKTPGPGAVSQSLRNTSKLVNRICIQHVQSM